MRLVKERGIARELSAKSGVPQSHISKIENGAVDLELERVSKKTVPAVKSIVRSSASADLATAHKMIQKEMNLYENVIASATQVSSLANSDLKKIKKSCC